MGRKSIAQRTIESAPKIGYADLKASYPERAHQILAWTFERVADMERSLPGSWLGLFEQFADLENFLTDLEGREDGCSDKALPPFLDYNVFYRRVAEYCRMHVQAAQAAAVKPAGTEVSIA